MGGKGTINGHTVDLERLQRAAARLGDAAIDPSIWPEIMADISAAVGRVALNSMTNALELVRQPAFALDQSGNVLDTNRLAAPLLGSGIHIRNGRLVLCDRHAAAALDALISRLGTASDIAALPTQPIVVHRDGKRPLVMTVLPVDGAARAPFLGARVLLTLTDLDAENKPDAELIARAFGLSPAETRLALLVGNGSAPTEAAEELGIARETARSQLKTVFAKTGTHRQAELVALLARIARLPNAT